ncbi:major facilitator family transporter [Lactobacillus ultunensis DSM 16047]|nr:major facilitator family transporter [Lactobacillus ultunensis DSM 16047]
MNKKLVNKKTAFFSFLIIGTAWMFDAMDVGLLSFIMPMVKKEWNLINSEAGLISSISTIGMICGGFYFGHLADKIGRKKTLIITLLTFSIGNIVLAAASNYQLFLIIRFFVGMGLGGELPVAATYISDLYHGKKRSQMLIMVDSFWAIGWLIASFISFLFATTIGWRGLLLLTALMGFFALMIRKNISEIKEPSHLKTGIVTAIRNSFHGWTILLWLAWLMVMFSYYGMFMWLPSIMLNKGNTVIQSFGYTTIIVVAQLPGYFVAVWLSGYIKTKYVFAIYMLGTALGAWMFGNVTSSLWTIIAGCILSFFNLGAYGAIISLTPTLYKDHVRGTMTGLAEGIGRIGAVVGPALVGMWIDQHVKITMIFLIFMLALLIGAFAVLLLPEGQQEEDNLQ